jgi:hypothetical protein
MRRARHLGAYGPSMSDSRYGHTNVSGGDQDQGERKDEGWKSRQGGRQSRESGKDPVPSDTPGRDRASTPPPGTNTQGELAGIGEASRDTREELHGMMERAYPDAGQGDGEASDRDPGAGTDQPPRMGGPLGPDPERPHLPEGAQDNEEKGTGAGGFDRGVDATNVGAVHQGARPEDQPD